METEIVQSVINEVLEELKEVKLQQLEQTKSLTTLTHKVESFEQKISEIKVLPPVVDTTPIALQVADGMNRLKNIIEAQPKIITKNFRFLLFPEYNATEYYKIVFGRLLFWIMIFLIATYFFVLCKHFIEGRFRINQNEIESARYRKAWDYLYQHGKRTMRLKMDSAWNGS